MKIKLQGELSIPELRQALYEQLSELEEGYLVRHSKDITLYLTPTNGFGEEVICRDARGREVTTLYCRGPYRSAAEHYDL